MYYQNELRHNLLTWLPGWQFLVQFLVVSVMCLVLPLVLSRCHPSASPLFPLHPSPLHQHTLELLMPLFSMSKWPSLDGDFKYKWSCCKISSKILFQLSYQFFYSVYNRWKNVTRPGFEPRPFIAWGHYNWTTRAVSVQWRNGAGAIRFRKGNFDGKGDFS